MTCACMHAVVPPKKKHLPTLLHFPYNKNNPLYVYVCVFVYMYVQESLGLCTVETSLGGGTREGS